LLKKTVSGIMLTLLLTSMLTLAFNIGSVKASGTIYIRADGSIDPTTAPIQRVGNIYTFSSSIYDPIVVEKSNIIIDGNSYALQGHGMLSIPYETGIDLAGADSVTIKRAIIKGWARGVDLSGSQGNSIFENHIANNYRGIYGEIASGNTISGNTIQDNGYDGISLWASWDHSILSNHNVISRNIITNNLAYGIVLQGLDNTVSDNYMESCDFTLTWASGNRISGNTLTNTDWGIFLDYESNDNLISRNNVTKSVHNGITIQNSTGNVVSGNNITDNGQFGIFLGSAASANDIYENIIANNKKDNIEIWGSSNNKVYHNDLIANTAYATLGYANTWDDGYPSGGNYWSGYTGVDLKSGPSQDQPGSDGIGDTPYVINTDNRDRYPLMSSYTQTGIADSFRFPLDEPWTNGRRFGKFYTNDGYHLGEDMWKDFEAPVYAPANGVVKFSDGPLGGKYGYVVVIEHQLADGTFVCSVLGHLRSQGRVTSGSTVTKGQVIGYLSSVESENGGVIHSHFGIRKGKYSLEQDRDGKWRYRGYCSASDIVDLWFPPTTFINYYDLHREAPEAKMNIVGKCPVDLMVVDPEGFNITKDDSTSRMSYMELDINGNGELEDRVTVWEKKTGNYLITVMPTPDADPNATYTLEVSADNVTLVLAEYAKVSDIPAQPYQVSSTEARITFFTDLNRDGKVNIQDITIVAIAYKTRPGDPNWNVIADLDENGTVNIVDITMVAKDYGRTI
jgi:parallel beta-helix repeat protein